jgi:hypothetical protein
MADGDGAWVPPAGAWNSMFGYMERRANNEKGRAMILAVLSGAPIRHSPFGGRTSGTVKYLNGHFSFFIECPDCGVSWRQE